MLNVINLHILRLNNSAECSAAARTLLNRGSHVEWMDNAKRGIYVHVRIYFTLYNRIVIIILCIYIVFPRSSLDK